MTARPRSQALLPLSLSLLSLSWCGLDLNVIAAEQGARNTF